MSTQSEAKLENKLISQLQTLGFERVAIADEAALPACLVQIELKHRELELKEAFNQTNRDHQHSFSPGGGLSMVCLKNACISGGRGYWHRHRIHLYSEILRARTDLHAISR